MWKLSFTIPKSLQGNPGLNGAVPQWLHVTSLGVRPEVQSLGIMEFLVTDDRLLQSDRPRDCRSR
jgi:hypothetical protein